MGTETTTLVFKVLSPTHRASQKKAVTPSLPSTFIKQCSVLTNYPNTLTNCMLFREPGHNGDTARIPPNLGGVNGKSPYERNRNPFELFFGEVRYIKCLH